MSIGYACKVIGVADSNFKSCILKNATPEVLVTIILHNLNALDHIIDYNIKMGISLFRISSDLIPFGSGIGSSLNWNNQFNDKFLEIGEKIINANMRVSMHPGQYTVINSPNQDVVKRSILDLEYHCKVLDTMQLGQQHKLVLHIGGAYQDKPTAIKRFKANYSNLDDCIKARLVIENDDKLFNIEEVYQVGIELNCPVVFDSLHHEINPCNSNRTQHYWIEACKQTWKKLDGNQKIHYSQQADNKKIGSHSSTISLQEFLSFYHEVFRDNLDIMLEVKDKNLSAVKCINATRKDVSIKHLKQEWSKFQYTILEKDAFAFEKIKQLLNKTNHYPVEEFYQIVDQAVSKAHAENSLQALLAVWECFDMIADQKQKERFFKDIEKFEVGKLSLLAIKKRLLTLACQYQQEHLLDSYYFDL